MSLPSAMALLRAIRHGHQPILIDFPPRPRPRWGYGQPAHEALRALFDRDRGSYRTRIAEILEHAERLATIPANGSAGTGDA